MSLWWALRIDLSTPFLEPRFLSRLSRWMRMDKSHDPVITTLSFSEYFINAISRPCYEKLYSSTPLSTSNILICPLWSPTSILRCDPSNSMAVMSESTILESTRMGLPTLAFHTFTVFSRNKLTITSANEKFQSLWRVFRAEDGMVVRELRRERFGILIYF